jgi:hypothetical protein
MTRRIAAGSALGRAVPNRTALRRTALGRTTAAGAVLAVIAAALVASGAARAQTPEALTARLSWVPVSQALLSDVSGSGAVTATLSGRRLSITGTFEGLPAAATAARLHRGAATGASGPAIADLEVAVDAAHDTNGTIIGTVELDRSDLAALRAAHLYIQIHAEHGVEPDNAVLRGWLLAPAKPVSARRANR